MQTDYQILELFPTPVFTTMIPDRYSSIIPWLYQQEMLSEDIDDANYGQRSKNSYILDEPQAGELKKYILDLAGMFGSQMLKHDYDEYRFGQSWISYKHPGQHHTMHSHPNSLISGVFYYGEPSDNTPAIKFHKLLGGMNVSYISPKTKKDKRDSKYAIDFMSVDFRPGLLLLFPSYVHHSVPVNKTDKVRCSLAFNIVPKVGFGDEMSLTELKF
jgi:uncharacterized protein (TIGR02466 family)